MSTELSKNPIKDFFNSDGVKSKFQELLGNQATGFVTNVLQLCSNSKDLSQCDPMALFYAASTAAILKLPINPNLSYAAIIPYKDNQAGTVTPQFQIMKNGFIQLGLRSGQYKKINCTDVREGELQDYDRLTDTFVFNWERDFQKREKLPVIGYCGYFSLLEGFEKIEFWTVTEVREHGARYSRSFNKSSGLWNVDFAAMANKTVLKSILKNWGPMSVELNMAYTVDQATITKITDNEPAVRYIDREEEELEETTTRKKRTKEEIAVAAETMRQRFPTIATIEELDEYNKQDLAAAKLCVVEYAERRKQLKELAEQKTEDAVIVTESVIHEEPAQTENTGINPLQPQFDELAAIAKLTIPDEAIQAYLNFCGQHGGLVSKSSPTYSPELANAGTAMVKEKGWQIKAFLDKQKAANAPESTPPPAKPKSKRENI